METRTRIASVVETLGYEYFWRPAHGDDGLPFYAWFVKRDPRRGRAHIVSTWRKNVFRITATNCCFGITSSSIRRSRGNMNA